MIGLENVSLAEDLLTGVLQHLPSTLKELRLNKNLVLLVRQEAFLKLENVTQLDL